MAATLAIGVGAATSIYGVFDQLLFAPVAGVEADARLITVTFSVPGRSASGPGSPEALQALRRAGSQAGLDALAYSCCGSAMTVRLPGQEDAALTKVDFVSSQYFSLLGVRSLVGRLFTDHESDTASENVAVVSERLWRASLGNRATLGNAALTVNGVPFAIIGVTKQFRGWGAATRIGDTDVWLPMASERAVMGTTSAMSRLVGRVSHTASIATIERSLQAAYASGLWTSDARQRAFLPVVDEGLWPATRAIKPAVRLYWLLMAGVSLVLALSCVNAASLLLVQARVRVHDIAVRLALGATHWSIVRQTFFESFGLSLLVGSIGLVVAKAIVGAIEHVRLLPYLPGVEGVPIDGRVAAVCFGTSLVTVMACNLVPALASMRDGAATVTRGAWRSVASTHYWGHGALVTTQIALALVVVCGAGVLHRSFENLSSADLGLDINGVVELVLKTDHPGGDRSAAKVSMLAVTEGLRQAGIGPVSVATSPLSVNGDTIGVRTTSMSGVKQIHPAVNSVSLGYFDVMRIPLQSGRSFSDPEFAAGEGANPLPVLLNRTLAAGLFGGQSAVGQSFDLIRYSNSGPAETMTTATVVGVVGDTSSLAVRGAALPALYHPGDVGAYGSVLVRTRGSVAQAMTQIRQVVRATSNGMPIVSMRALTERVSDRLGQDRALARLGAILALLSIVLALTGVASVVSRVVTDRVREFGIRMALGASTKSILGLVLRSVLGPCALGVAAGLSVYWSISRLMSARLYGVNALDPLVIAVVIVTLPTVTVVAALIPGSRATKVDPAMSLRTD